MDQSNKVSAKEEYTLTLTKEVFSNIVREVARETKMSPQDVNLKNAVAVGLGFESAYEVKKTLSALRHSMVGMDGLEPKALRALCRYWIEKNPHNQKTSNLWSLRAMQLVEFATTGYRWEKLIQEQSLAQDHDLKDYVGVNNFFQWFSLVRLEEVLTAGDRLVLGENGNRVEKDSSDWKSVPLEVKRAGLRYVRSLPGFEFDPRKPLSLNGLKEMHESVINILYGVMCVLQENGKEVHEVLRPKDVLFGIELSGEKAQEWEQVEEKAVSGQTLWVSYKTIESKKLEAGLQGKLDGVKFVGLKIREEKEGSLNQDWIRIGYEKALREKPYPQTWGLADALKHGLKEGYRERVSALLIAYAQKNSEVQRWISGQELKEVRRCGELEEAIFSPNLISDLREMSTKQNTEKESGFGETERVTAECIKAMKP